MCIRDRYRYGYQVADGFPVPQQQVVLADDQSAPPVERNRLWFWLRDRFGLGLGGRLGEDLEDLVLGLFPDRCDEAVGGKAQQAAVDDAALELQGLAGLDRIPFALLADRGEVLPDRRRQRQHRKIFAQHPANRAGSLLGAVSYTHLGAEPVWPVGQVIAAAGWLRRRGGRLRWSGSPGPVACRWRPGSAACHGCGAVRLPGANRGCRPGWRRSWRRRRALRGRSCRRGRNW